MLFRRVFFFNHPSTTEIYTLSLHDALPIYCDLRHVTVVLCCDPKAFTHTNPLDGMSEGGLVCERFRIARSEEHTSELQSLRHLVCRLLLEKKKIRRT